MQGLACPGNRSSSGRPGSHACPAKPRPGRPVQLKSKKGLSWDFASAGKGCHFGGRIAQKRLRSSVFIMRIQDMHTLRTKRPRWLMPFAVASAVTLITNAGCTLAGWAASAAAQGIPSGAEPTAMILLGSGLVGLGLLLRRKKRS